VKINFREKTMGEKIVDIYEKKVEMELDEIMEQYFKGIIEEDKFLELKEILKFGIIIGGTIEGLKEFLASPDGIEITLDALS
jgi:hypothetical protein